ncbi:hypothetical protein P7K49_020474 [Saguinus oedipus]|uniref:Uncharacterized protein n=1 Tax=Saguinus oedipus TaxID=9490 RepID=A0ABQ9V0N0_SAGOE|nr:hypothetical protein P7K49_020474 [Saguinus oedipus]
MRAADWSRRPGDVTSGPAPSPSRRAARSRIVGARAGPGRRPSATSCYSVSLGSGGCRALLMAADVFMCSPRRPRNRGRPVLLKPQVPEDDDDSDTDEPSPPPVSGAATPARAHASTAPPPPRAGSGRDEPPRRQQIIHSGHFMVSSPHREHPPKKGYDFDTVNKQTCQTYSFGKTSSCHLSIDASLTKLFECMTLAYR